MIGWVFTAEPQSAQRYYFFDLPFIRQNNGG
jgi:hypothetical protein